MEDLANGELSMEAVEAVKRSDPKLYAVMVGETLRAVEDTTSPLSYDQKIVLSLFTGQAIDPSLSPETIGAMQAAYAPSPSAKKGPGGRIPLRSARHIRSAEMAAVASASQRLESGEANVHV